MAGPLQAPSKNVFDPAKGYNRVRFVGDRTAQDFELNEVQQIFQEKLRQTFDRVFAVGAIIDEAGGSVGIARQGAALANVAAMASGTYKGFATQIYTLTVSEGGGPGTAKIKVKSDGPDNGVEGAGYQIAVAETDPLNGTVQYDVGSEGIKIAFTDGKAVKSFTVADTWIILATHNRSLPVPNAGASTIMMLSASIYIDGQVVIIPATTLSFPPAIIGKNVVYVQVLKDIVTAGADPSIKAALTNETVAERERWLASFQDHDTTTDALPPTVIERRVFPAYIWDRATNKTERAYNRPISFLLGEIPGQLQAASLSDIDFSEELRAILAEANTDITGGSYRIDGLKARVSTNPPPTNKALITVERGKGRVSGFKIVRETEEDILIDLALDTTAVIDEAKTFLTGTNVYSLNQAVGATKFPIKDIIQLTAIVQIVRSVTKGSTNGLDALPDTPVSSIISVVQGATTYVVGTSYVQNGDFVDWSPGGAEPTGGTSYDVTYRFTKQMALTTDFLLIDTDGDGKLDSVDFSPAGDNPVNNTVFFVDYNYYLPRIDRIILRTDKQLVLLKGTPSDTPVAPSVPTEFLGICEIAMGPNSTTNIKVKNFDNVRISMAAIRDAIHRQEDLIRNDATQNLLNQTKLRETAAFKGIFTDAFAGEENSDRFFSRPAGLGGVSPGTQITYDCLLDLFALEMQLPVIISTPALAKDDLLLPAGALGSHYNRDFATLPFSEVLAIEQDQWSEERNINPFANFSPPPPDITLIPDKDVSVNEQISELNDVYFSYTGSVFHATDADVQALSDPHPHFIATGRSAEEISRLIEERAGLYMRQLLVEVHGRRFFPGEDNIALAFDGKTVALTPINSTPAGTTAGTVKARPPTFDVNNEPVTYGGEWEATFTIPANVPSGVRSAVASGGSGSVASAPYEGNFLERFITLIQRLTIAVADPLAQSFGFSQPTTLVRVEIPFAAKGNNSQPPVDLQLRSVELPGGFPGSIVLDSVLKKSETIVTGTTSVNSFQFPNPRLQLSNTLLALVLMTNSTAYRVFSATLGRAGFNPVAFITQNPNLRGTEPAGILLESLNAINWESASRSCLRYRLYRAEFLTQSWIYFTRISSVQFCKLFLNVDQVIPEGTNVLWQVSIDGLTIGNVNKKWIDIKPFSLLDLGTIATTIDLRAKLSTTNTRVSPYVNWKNWALHGILYKAAGKYVSKATQFSQDIGSTKVYVEVKTPAVSTLTYFITNGEDSSGNPIWETVTQVDADVDLGDGFHELSLSKTLNNGIAQKTSKRRVRVRIDLATSNQAFSGAVRNLAVSLT